MSVLRKIVSKMASPLDRYVKRRVVSKEWILSNVYRTAGYVVRDEAERLVQKTMPRLDLQFEVHLAEHCNLNCAGCEHFAPLAKKEFTDLNEYTRDFKRLSQLFDGRVRFIHLMGGEPLLNPAINDFMRVARECFPITSDFDVGGGIYIVTNGVLLPQMDKSFWECCRKYDIGIRPTKYPIPCDYDAMEKKAHEEGVKYGYYNDAQVIKTLYRLPLDLTGNQNAEHNFLMCHRSNYCINLKHGKLYTCSVAPHAHHFRDALAPNMVLSPNDGIDIYTHTAREIMEFLARPIPFCRYCNIDGTKYDLPYGPSHRCIDEWS